MSTEDKIAVMQAFEDGKDLEVANKGEERWVSTVMPIWNWVAYNYRIKPAPASQLDRIKAEYAEFEVVELVWDDRGLWTMKDHGCYDSAYLHTTAQSMKGFHMYVYHDERFATVTAAKVEDDFFHLQTSPFDGSLPLVALFTK